MHGGFYGNYFAVSVQDGDKCHMDVSVQDGDKCHMDVPVQDGDKWLFKILQESRITEKLLFKESFCRYCIVIYIKHAPVHIWCPCKFGATYINYYAYESYFGTYRCLAPGI